MQMSQVQKLSKLYFISENNEVDLELWIIAVYQFLSTLDAAKKRRLDEQNEGNRPETRSSENDKNSEPDQIPEAAAKVITKWFRDHQGVKYLNI